MTDKDLFEEVLKNFQDNYKLKIEKPNNDCYIIINDNSGSYLGEMNYSGYNLLYNLTRLCDILKFELT